MDMVNSLKICIMLLSKILFFEMFDTLMAEVAVKR